MAFSGCMSSFGVRLAGFNVLQDSPIDPRTSHLEQTCEPRQQGSTIGHHEGIRSASWCNNATAFTTEELYMGVAKPRALGFGSWF